MKSLRPLAAILVWTLALVGCANPTFTNQSQNFVPVGWKTIAILPFGGESRFAESATQTFAIHLMNVPGFRIVQPSTVSVSVRDLGVVQTPSGFTVLEAQRLGRAVNADAVIAGTVTSYNNGATLNGFCTAQIIDVASGEIVAATHNPSGLLLGYSEHQCVMAATERSGKEILRILQDLSRKNRPTEPPLTPAKRVKSENL